MPRRRVSVAVVSKFELPSQSPSQSPIPLVSSSLVKFTLGKLYINTLLNQIKLWFQLIKNAIYSKPGIYKDSYKYKLMITFILQINVSLQLGEKTLKTLKDVLFNLPVYTEIVVCWINYLENTQIVYFMWSGYSHILNAIYALDVEWHWMNIFIYSLNHQMEEAIWHQLQSYL